MIPCSASLAPEVPATGLDHRSPHPSLCVFISFKLLSETSVIRRDLRGMGEGSELPRSGGSLPQPSSSFPFYLFIYFGANLRCQRSVQSLLTAPKSTSIILRPFGSSCHGDQKQNGMQINTAPRSITTGKGQPDKKKPT